MVHAQDMGFTEELAARLRSARLAAGMTQTQLANGLGMRHASVSEYERGVTTPGAETIVSLAKALGVSTEWLMTGANVTPERVGTEDPALRAFLATPMGRTTSDSERATLSSMMFIGATPTEATYQAVLVGLRGTTHRGVGT